MNDTDRVELFRSVIEHGRDALKAAILINGAAAVALLAFIGKIWSMKNSLSTADPLAYALLVFGSGVLFAGVSSAFTLSLL